MSAFDRIQAYGGLVKHYISVFAFYWRHRQYLSAGGFRDYEAEFLPGALSIQESPVSPSLRLTAVLLMLLFIGALLWATLGKIDIVVNADGKIIPSDRTKAISSIDTASVKTIYVQDNQKVSRGDLLLDLDSSGIDSEYERAKGDRELAQIQILRQRALVASVESGRLVPMKWSKELDESKYNQAQRHLEEQYFDFTAKLHRFDDDIRITRSSLEIAVGRVQDYAQLLKNGDVSRHSYLEREQARLDIEARLSEAKNQRQSLITETKKLAYDSLLDSSKLLGESAQDAEKAKAHSHLLKLTSPIDGTVQQLNVHTIGAAVPAAQPLMLVVPNDGGIEVEASLENKDVGFVAEGQEVAVKVAAFEYTKYGTIPGKVSHVSHDAIQDEKRGLLYQVRIHLDRSSLLVDGKESQIVPGMAINAEIKTGTRRVIEYVLTPLLQHKRESLNER
ncbi:HlyD family type I secretion periplasmic adaptor subunit [Herbaspirillum seropedicae]|uniref:HlyD family type I secretion periplasmic adaptor subunit n=1 Tax=Herbaspirillum seropedicae TaxID=964 RepID=UPI003F8D8C29